MTDQQQPTPLWEVMRDANFRVGREWGNRLAPAGLIRAAEIEALADVILKELDAFETEQQLGVSAVATWLLDEARRAREAVQ